LAIEKYVLKAVIFPEDLFGKLQVKQVKFGEQVLFATVSSLAAWNGTSKG
jgi:hypothetical protein